MQKVNFGTARLLLPTTMNKTVLHIESSAKSTVDHDQLYGFDLDGTLIGSVRDGLIHVNINIKKKLTELSETSDIVIFTNQFAAPENLESILSRIVSELGIPVHLYAALKKDKFRKPETGMFDLLPKKYKKITFVGDAAGREGDFSDSDLVFSKNIGATFKTPEEFFDYSFEIPEEIQLIILVGFPASGKTTLVKDHLEKIDFVSVSRDELGTIPRCVKRAKELLKEGKHVVIDNLNATRDARKMFIFPGINTACIRINKGMLECMSRNEKREKKVPKIVFYKFRKSFEDPSLDEGFSWIYDDIN